MIEDVLLNLRFLNLSLPHVFTLSTGLQTLETFEVTGQPFDQGSGEVVLVGLVLGPPSGLSPPIATALIIEGVLRPGD